MVSMFRTGVNFLGVALIKSMNWVICYSTMILIEGVKKYVKSHLRLSYHQFFKQ
jgi:hypothetical protein